MASIGFGPVLNERSEGERAANAVMDTR